MTMTNKKRKRSSSTAPKHAKHARIKTLDTVSRSTSTPRGAASRDVDEPATRSLLSTIPTELLEYVADYLTGPDLGSLRQTCREIFEKVDYAYTVKCFTDRCFLLSNEGSLSILFNISTHEKYSKSMRRLQFCPAIIEPLPRNPRPIEDRAERRHRRDQKRLHHKVWSRQLTLYCHNNLASYLCVILKNFRAAGNTPKLALSFPSDKDFKEPWGWEALQAITKLEQPARRDFLVHYTSLFIAVLKTQYKTEELRFGSREHELPMTIFNANTETFPGTRLVRLELSLSLSGDEYEADDDGNYINCALRREHIQYFVRFIAQAQNLEHLLLHLSPIMDFLDAVEDTGEPDHSSLRADVFHSLVTKSYLDGTPIEVESTMLLPKLKSIDLGYHQIELRQLIRFFTDRVATLEEISLKRIVDLDASTKHDHEDVVQQIRTAIGGDSKTDLVVEVADSCYSGDGFFDLFRWQDAEGYYGRRHCRNCTHDAGTMDGVVCS